MTITYPIRRDTPEASALKQAFDRYAEESVTDEQVERVLAPVLAMIRAGAFDRPKPRHVGGPLRSLAAAAAVLVLVAAAAPWKRGGQAPPTAAGSGPAVIRDGSAPLAAPPTANRLSGRVLFTGGNTGAAVLRLVDANTRKTVAETQAAPDGAYTFSGFPKGTYEIEVMLPDGAVYAAGVWRNGQADGLTFGRQARAMEGVDITV